MTRPWKDAHRGEPGRNDTVRTLLWKWFFVIPIVLAMLLIMVLAGGVVLYVAFPHRGEEMPHTPWVGEAMRKGVNMLPTLDNQRERQD